MCCLRRGRSRYGRSSPSHLIYRNTLPTGDRDGTAGIRWWAEFTWGEPHSQALEGWGDPQFKLNSFLKLGKGHTLFQGEVGSPAIVGCHLDLQLNSVKQECGVVECEVEWSGV